MGESKRLEFLYMMEVKLLSISLNIYQTEKDKYNMISLIYGI